MGHHQESLLRSAVRCGPNRLVFFAKWDWLSWFGTWVGISAHSFKSQTWHECSHFLDLFQALTGVVFSVGVTHPSTTRRLWWLRQSQVDRPVAQSLGGAHRGRVYVRAFIGVSVRACVCACVCTVFQFFFRITQLTSWTGNVVVGPLFKVYYYSFFLAEVY